MVTGTWLNCIYKLVLQTSENMFTTVFAAIVIIPYNYHKFKLYTIIKLFYFYFQCLIGKERQNCPLPISFTEEEYNELTQVAKDLNLETDPLETCYVLTDSSYCLVKDR